MKYLERVICTRVNEDTLKITWGNEDIKEMKVYLEGNNEETLIGKISNSNEMLIKDPDRKKRNIFLLKADGYHSELVGEVIIPFKGAHHFRDIGGYRSSDGRRVKWNTFFRGDKLSDLTDEDIEYFKELGIKTILDLRSKKEVNSSPDPVVDGVKYINLSGIPELDDTKDDFDMLSIFNKKSLVDFDGEDFLIKGYKSMVFNNSAYKELVDCMENEERLPIIFHCSAGKDRTGFGAALILSILGVPEEKIIEDYLSSNIYRKSINDKIIESVKKLTDNPKHIELLRLMLEVKREFIEASFNSIKDKYGTMDRYLESEYGITKTKRKELKKRFLY